MQKLASGSMAILYYPKKRGYNVDAELKKIDKSLPPKFGFNPITPEMAKTEFGWLCRKTGMEIRLVESKVKSK